MVVSMGVNVCLCTKSSSYDCLYYSSAHAELFIIIIISDQYWYDYCYYYYLVLFSEFLRKSKLHLIYGLR